MIKGKSTSSQNPATSTKASAGLGVWALAAIVVSSMIGGGIYSLPQNMAAGASAGAVLLAWVITGFGVYFIANTFRVLLFLSAVLCGRQQFNIHNRRLNFNLGL